MEGVVKNKHSERGIISCFIWLLATILLVLLILDVLKIVSFPIINMYTVVVMVLLSLFLQLCAFILAISGLFQKDRKKAFPILGTVLSILGFWWVWVAAFTVIGEHISSIG